MKESDWKRFRKVKDIALERYCEEALSDVEKVLFREGGSFHEKYLSIYKLIENADKKLGLLFDGHSRSKAAMQLMLIRNEGLVADNELEGMSEEFISSTKPG